MFFGHAARLRVRRKPSRFCSLRTLVRYRQNAPARAEIATRQRERAEASRRETLSRILGPLREPPSLYPLERPSVLASFIADLDQPLESYTSPPTPEAFVSSLSSLLTELTQAQAEAEAQAGGPDAGASPGAGAPGTGSMPLAPPISSSLPREADAVSRFLLSSASDSAADSAAFGLDVLDAARRALERLHRESDRALLDPLAPRAAAPGDVWAEASRARTPDDPLYRYATLDAGADRAPDATLDANADLAPSSPAPSTASSSASSSSFSSALASYASLSPEVSPDASPSPSLAGSPPPSRAASLPGAARRARGAALRAAMRSGGFYQVPRGGESEAAAAEAAASRGLRAAEAPRAAAAAAAASVAAPAAPALPAAPPRLAAREPSPLAHAPRPSPSYAPVLRYARLGGWSDGAGASGGAAVAGAAVAAGGPAVHVAPVGDVAVRVEMADVDGSWIDEEEDERAKAKLAEARARGGRRRRGGRQ